MKILEPVFIQAIEKLFLHNVKFILIGGYAVNFHGYGRYTGDIDFWLKPDLKNKEKFLVFFTEMCTDKNYTDAIHKLDFSAPQCISMGEPPFRIDFLTKVNFVSFDEAWEKRVFFSLKDIKVPVVDYHHLILTKFNTDRPKDKLDLEQLQKINQLKNKGK